MLKWPRNMLRISIFLLSAVAALAAEDGWVKLRELKSGTELRIYKIGTKQAVAAKMDEATAESLRVVVKDEQVAIGKDQIDRVDYKPAGANGRFTRETRLKGHDGAAQAEADMKSHPRGSPDSTSSGINIRPKSGFETVYRREEAAATK